MKRIQTILGWFFLSIATFWLFIISTTMFHLVIGVAVGLVPTVIAIAIKLINKDINLRNPLLTLVITMIIALPSVPVAINWWNNSNDPGINAHLQIVAINPRTGLEGRETVSIEIGDVRGGFGLGTHTISYELLSFPERERVHGGILYDQDRLLMRWGRNRVDLITQFTFEPHRSYILTVYVNNSAVQFLYGNTLRDEILISSR